MNILLDRPKALKHILSWMENNFGNVVLFSSEGYYCTWFIDKDGLIVSELTSRGELHVMPPLFMQVESIFSLEDRTSELMGIFEMYFEKKFDVIVDKVSCSWGTNLFGVGDNISEF